MQVGKSLTHSVGGYLPNTLTEMWEPSRDFAFLRLPTSGARCIVALSGCVITIASCKDIDIFRARCAELCRKSWLSRQKATSTRTISIWRMAENVPS